MLSACRIASSESGRWRGIENLCCFSPLNECLELSPNQTHSVLTQPVFRLFLSRVTLPAEAFSILFDNLSQLPLKAFYSALDIRVVHYSLPARAGIPCRQIIAHLACPNRVSSSESVALPRTSVKQAYRDALFERNETDLLRKLGTALRDVDERLSGLAGT